MNIVKLSLKKINTKLIFSLICFSIAGAALMFSLFYTNSIKQEMIKTLPLEKNEYHTYMTESNYETIPTNYYKVLKETFEVVIPYVHDNTIDENGQIYQIIGTDIGANKLYLFGQFVEYEITEIVETNSELPKIYLNDIYKEQAQSLPIKLNNIEYEIAGWYQIKELEKIEFDIEMNKDMKIGIMTLEDYSTYYDTSIVSSKSGILKMYIDDYYIRTSMEKEEVIHKLLMIYNASESFYFVDTYDKLLDKKMNEFTIFSSVPTTFFILVSVFSFFNIFIAVNLSIREQKHYYTTLMLLGMKLSDLKKMISIEASAISFASSIISTILGIIVTRIVISFSNEIIFSWLPFGIFALILILITAIPIVQTLISVQFIKYKHIIK